MSLMQWLSKTKTRSHTEKDRVIIESTSTSTTKVTDENGGRDRQHHFKVFHVVSFKFLSHYRLVMTVPKIYKMILILT